MISILRNETITIKANAVPLGINLDFFSAQVLSKCRQIYTELKTYFVLHINVFTLT